MKKLQTNIENLCRFLTDGEEDDTLALERIAEVTDLMNKQMKLKKFCNLEKIKYRKEINQYYIYVNRKQFCGKTEKQVIDKLFNHFCGEFVRTLEDAFCEWMHWRKDIQTNSKTLKENLNEWNNYISKSPIAKIQVAKLKIKDFEDFFYEITGDYAITTKRLSNVVSVLNGIMKRCVSLGIISHNILDDVYKSPFHRRCKPCNSKKEIYTLEERTRILNYLADKTDIYSLAISLSFYFCLRIGELIALKYSDVANDSISIKRSRRTTQEMNDDLSFTPRTVTNDERIKGNKSTGFRDYPLMKKSKMIIDRIHTLNPDSEFLLMNNGQQLNGDTFNEKLKAVCDALGIKYRSSHQIRFTVATLLYEANVPITQISLLLGHSNTATTWNYIRQQKANTQTLEIMQSVLG